MHAEAGKHVVKPCVFEGQILGIGGNPLDLHTRLGSPAAAGVKELGGQVAGDHLRARHGCGDGGVAATGGNVEDVGARADPGPLDDALADVGDELSAPRIITGGPGSAMGLLECLCVDDCAHGPLFRSEFPGSCAQTVCAGV